MSDVFETGRIKLSETEVAFCSYEPSERGETVRGLVKGAVKVVPCWLVSFANAPPEGDLVQFEARVALGWFSGSAADECHVSQLERLLRGLRELRGRTKDELNFDDPLEGAIRLHFTRTSETSDVIRVTGTLSHPFGNWQHVDYDVIDDCREPFPATLTFAFQMNDAQLDDTIPGLDTLCRKVRTLALQVPRTEVGRPND